MAREVYHEEVRTLRQKCLREMGGGTCGRGEVLRQSWWKKWHEWASCNWTRVCLSSCSLRTVSQDEAKNIEIAFRFLIGRAVALGAFRRWGVEQTVGPAPYKAKNTATWWERKGIYQLHVLASAITWNSMLLMIKHVNAFLWRLKDLLYYCQIPLEISIRLQIPISAFFPILLQIPCVHIVEYLCHFDSLKMVICFFND